MTFELGVEDSGAIPKVVLRGHIPHVRDKEDVPHEHAIPDLYGLGRGFTLSELGNAVRGERRLKAELLELIDQCTEMVCREDDETPGVLIIRTRAYSKRRPRAAVGYVDVIMSDRMDNEGRTRVRSLLVELHGELMVEVERVSIDRPHAQLPGSNSFKIIRYAKAVLA
ncbi:hypothetical protein ACFVYF_18745 [Streptomyces sp. NPDC058274]|uniref:hypothetical protein n=1 Tax=Streptomyces sp. NPDC058274 TaxID=3346416 RepID=UPI0036E7F143